MSESIKTLNGNQVKPQFTIGQEVRLQFLAFGGRARISGIRFTEDEEVRYDVEVPYKKLEQNSVLTKIENVDSAVLSPIVADKNV